MNWDLTSHFMSDEWNKATAVHGGTTYNCIPLEQSADSKFQDAGFMADVKKTLLFKIADLVPEPDSEIIFGGVTYKVLNTDPDSAGITIKVYLGAQYG